MHQQKAISIIHASTDHGLCCGLRNDLVCKTHSEPCVTRGDLVELWWIVLCQIKFKHLHSAFLQLILFFVNFFFVFKHVTSSSPF